MEILHICPVCKGASFTHFLTVTDYTVSKEQFSIVTCKQCGFKFTNPRPTVNDLGRYYKSEEYISHSDTRKGLIARLYHIVRKFTLKGKVRNVEQNVSRGTLLDFGCGTGMFLQAAKKAGWKVYGVEPDDQARLLVKENTGQEAFPSFTELKEQLADVRFSAITLWHVLEHVPKLDETIDFLREFLTENGRLFVAVPNCKSADALHYKEHWAAFDVPRHLYHFEPRTIEILMKKGGFELVKMRPMKFDSYYVSMLSEKYKTGGTNLVRAVANGFYSNLVARGAGEYSSVIYIFKKSATS
jgi:SAM-dependent methyltransferase